MDTHKLVALSGVMVKADGPDKVYVVIPPEDGVAEGGGSRAHAVCTERLLQMVGSLDSSADSLGTPSD